MKIAFPNQAPFPHLASTWMTVHHRRQATRAAPVTTKCYLRCQVKKTHSSEDARFCPNFGYYSKQNKQFSGNGDLTLDKPLAIEESEAAFQCSKSCCSCRTKACLCTAWSAWCGPSCQPNGCTCTQRCSRWQHSQVSLNIRFYRLSSESLNSMKADLSRRIRKRMLNRVHILFTLVLFCLNRCLLSLRMIGF